MNNFAAENASITCQREITLLFADLRGFTEIAAALEIDPLVSELLTHVMDSLTDAVLARDGSVVDYYGDGLVAMWNAPADQANHAELACEAALAMLADLPAISDDWRGLIPSALRLGIGVHTGTAQLGNAGSNLCMKYGPRGPSVHIASRVEAATKLLGEPLIVTAATVEQLSDRLSTHRICRARLPGVSEPVALYALRDRSTDANDVRAWRLYERALEHFEQGQFERAADLLAEIDGRCENVPWRFLSSEVEREIGQQQRRRSTDQVGSGGPGVIALRVK